MRGPGQSLVGNTPEDRDAVDEGPREEVRISSQWVQNSLLFI